MKSQPKIQQKAGQGRSPGLLRVVGLLAGLSLCGWLMPAAHAAGGGLLEAPQAGDIAGQQGEQANSGPVRLARFAYLSGDVTWRTDAQSDWSPAARNMPLRQGAQLWVADGGRAEVQFDDGSRVRLDSNTLITLQTLFSDTDGEFTEITLNEGEVFLRLNNQYSLYQVNTPGASIKAAGPARLRVGGGEGAQFAVREGKATVEGASGKVTLQEGDYLDVADATTPYNVGPLPRADQWDTWNDSRDRQIDNPGQGAEHLPPNIALVAGNLDAYGRWMNDPVNGWIWVPRVTEADWRPYGAGQWTWVEPFGWTWVAAEPWGWAPYHYGTWVHASYGWGWCPGPATQYWSPAVVSFYESGGRVAWCPLAPREVVYPSALSVGFRGGNWSLFFSIGGAAVYYPGPERVCVARPWASTYVNHVTYVNNVTNITNITVNHNTYVSNNNFVPSNARFQGGTQVEAQSFGSARTAYRPVAAGDMAVFTRGRAIGAPSGGRPVAGPQSAPVTAQSLTPTRTFRPASTAPQDVVNRSVFRGALPANVPRAAAPTQSGQRFITRPAPGNIPGGNRPVFQPGTRPNAPAGTTGRSSALEQYLRERDAARGRGGNGDGASGANPGRNQPAQPPSRPNNTDNPRTDNRPPANPRDYTRPAQPDPNAPRRNTGDPGAPNPRDYRRTEPGQPTTPRNVPAQPRTDNYRPLHTRPTGGSGNNPPTRGGGDSRPRNSDTNGPDRSKGDRGHQ